MILLETGKSVSKNNSNKKVYASNFNFTYKNTGDNGKLETDNGKYDGYLLNGLPNGNVIYNGEWKDDKEVDSSADGEKKDF